MAWILILFILGGDDGHKVINRIAEFSTQNQCEIALSASKNEGLSRYRNSLKGFCIYGKARN